MKTTNTQEPLIISTHTEIVTAKISLYETFTKEFNGILELMKTELPKLDITARLLLNMISGRHIVETTGNGVTNYNALILALHEANINTLQKHMPLQYEMQVAIKLYTQPHLSEELSMLLHNCLAKMNSSISEKYIDVHERSIDFTSNHRNILKLENSYITNDPVEVEAWKNLSNALNNVSEIINDLWENEPVTVERLFKRVLDDNGDYKIIPLRTALPSLMSQGVSSAVAQFSSLPLNEVREQNEVGAINF